MTQAEFNFKVVQILADLAKVVGKDKQSEPKHGIVGDPIADAIAEIWDAAYTNSIHP